MLVLNIQRNLGWKIILWQYYGVSCLEGVITKINRQGSVVENAPKMRVACVDCLRLTVGVIPSSFLLSPLGIFSRQERPRGQILVLENRRKRDILGRTVAKTYTYTKYYNAIMHCYNLIVCTEHCNCKDNHDIFQLEQNLMNRKLPIRDWTWKYAGVVMII